MYQALYRKYRPNTLEDVCGQKTIVRIIKNSVKSNQINHAYLFSGPRGTGKTSVAKIFAKIVNCHNLKDCTPCGKCPSCTQANNSDIIEIDAASNNGVDEIRELKNKINLVPSYGKYKVYIIDEVHMLTVGAFNALLKTLEEPPEHIIFILATTDPQKIPETILSRCQRFEFKKISTKYIVENLEKISKKEKIKIDKQALEDIAILSNGGMRDSIGMLDQARTYTNKKITSEDIHDINGTLTDKDLNDLLEGTIDNNLEMILQNIDEFNNRGKNFSKLLEEFINHLRNILLLKKVPKYFKENYKKIENIEKISEKITTDEIFHYIDILNKYNKEIKQSNNTKQTFELAFIEMISEKDTRVSEVNKVEIIEKPAEKPKQYKQTFDKEENKRKKTEKKEIIQEEDTSNTENREKINEFIDYIKKIRVDNTLSSFNKKEMLQIKPILEEKLQEMLLSPEYSHEASMLLDGILKALSSEYIIFVYKTPSISHNFNENIIKLENAVEKALQKHYKLIALDSEEWEIVKAEFNHKKREFKYKKEDFNVEEVLNKQANDITKMFEDIIEYK